MVCSIVVRVAILLLFVVASASMPLMLMRMIVARNVLKIKIIPGAAECIILSGYHVHWLDKALDATSTSYSSLEVAHNKKRMIMVAQLMFFIRSCSCFFFLVNIES